MPSPGDQHNNNTVSNTVDTSGNTGRQWSYEEASLIQDRLAQELGPEFISYRPAPGGGRVSYLEGWKAINLANDAFGFNGWSSEVRNITIDYCDVDPDKRVSLGVTATVRVNLQDGTFHEDVGFGHVENAKTKYMAFDKCKKEATTDALKRALRKFGNSLGNCLYNNNFGKQVSRMSSRPYAINKERIVRDTNFRGGNPYGPISNCPQAPPSGPRPVLKIEDAPSNGQARPRTDSRPSSARGNRPSNQPQPKSQPPQKPPPRQQPPQSKSELPKEQPKIKREELDSRPETTGQTAPKPRSITFSVTTVDNRPILGPDSMYNLIEEGDFNGWDEDLSDDEIFGAEEFELKGEKPAIGQGQVENVTFNVLAAEMPKSSNGGGSKSSTPTPVELKTPMQNQNLNTLDQKHPQSTPTPLRDPIRTPSSEGSVPVGFYKGSAAGLIQDGEVPANSHFDPSYVSPNLSRLPNRSAPIRRSDVVNIMGNADNGNVNTTHNTHTNSTRPSTTIASDIGGKATNPPSYNNSSSAPATALVNKPSNSLHAPKYQPAPQLQAASRAGLPARGYGSPRTNQRTYGGLRNPPYSKPVIGGHSNGGTDSGNAVTATSSSSVSATVGQKRPAGENGDGPSASRAVAGESNSAGSLGGSENSANTRASLPSESTNGANQTGDKRQRVSY